MSVFLGATKGKKTRISAKRLQQISETAEMAFWKVVEKEVGRGTIMSYDYDSTYELQQEMDKAIKNFIKYNG
jgi:hypothetical protein